MTHEIARLNASLKEAIKHAEDTSTADMNTLHNEMREREIKHIQDLENTIKEVRKEAAITAEKAQSSAILTAISKEKSIATSAIEQLRSELTKKLDERERELIEKSKIEKEQLLESEREKAERTRNEALQAQKQELEQIMTHTLEATEKRLKEEAASALSAQALAASAQQREVLDAERRQARTEFEAAMKVAELKNKELEERTRELENNFNERVSKDVATAEARIVAENQKAMQQLQRETRSIVQRAEQERDDYQAMFVKENKHRKVLHNKILDLQGNIRVFCRVRPMVEVERKSGEGIEVTEFPTEEDLIIQKDPSSKAKYEFDRVFAPGSSQGIVFENVKPTCLSVLDGYNVCIFAYGQTGSGKTFTMEGYGDEKGISPRAINEIFDLIGSMTLEWSYQVNFSMLEIYNENIRDLLDSTENAQKERLDIRQTAEGNVVPGLTEVQVFSADQVLGLMADGQRNRAVGGHNMNALSSRSHMILTLSVKGRSLKDGGAQVSSGKLHLIDLAGSERVGKTDATGERLKEAQNINKSLSSLGDVIAALGGKSKGGHVPYRNSKLTFLLQDSLGGNSKVLMFVNISPVAYNASESICSLNFASRCRNTELGQAKKNVETRRQSTAVTGMTGAPVSDSPSMSKRVGSTANLRGR
eukprot:CAMPEP_0182420570 /NCGR_PEP_ID=MMETSP1167-20130531/5475_1 /TAXON_ID=2988 /ORGANISM="Mallomonas Sp, Strain CCMP3275" /LENGTH=648 /DNA_ID=CAMNT_0024596713 /DNA_START=41 /DNA_END=1987 /DNA_ORIENTATION=-